MLGPTTKIKTRLNCKLIYLTDLHYALKLTFLSDVPKNTYF
jgi:hypothetical protein